MFLLVAVSEGFWRIAAVVSRWHLPWFPVSSNRGQIPSIWTFRTYLLYIVRRTNTLVLSASEHDLNQITKFIRSRLELVSCVCLGDKSGLLSHCTIHSCWNSFRKCPLHWPEQGAAASPGAPGSSLPHSSGSPSASILHPCDVSVWHCTCNKASHHTCMSH